MNRIRTKTALAVCAVFALGAGFAQARTVWRWETVTLTPGESFHLHEEQIRLLRSWTNLWIEWETTGTAHVQLDMQGEFHLDPGDSIHANVHSSAPFVDWEKFTNIGQTVQELHGVAQFPGLPDQPIWVGPVIPGEMSEIHIEVDQPTPGADGFELAKWLFNDSGAPQWWGYESSTVAWVPFTQTDSLHLGIHLEHILINSAWLWIENDGMEDITFTVHFHITPTPGAVTLFAIAAPFALRRRR